MRDALGLTLAGKDGAMRGAVAASCRHTWRGTCFWLGQPKLHARMRVCSQCVCVACCAAAPVVLQDPGPVPGQAPNGDELLLLAEPVARANSFVGTEEYLAPEVRSEGCAGCGCGCGTQHLQPGCAGHNIAQHQDTGAEHDHGPALPVQQQWLMWLGLPLCLPACAGDQRSWPLVAC